MRIFYTDGSYGASGMKAGGWAFLETVNNEIIFEKCDADFSFNGTSNQMELKAAIEALKIIKDGESAKVHSDSQYVVKGMSEWIKGWKKNNWKTSKKEPVKNKELWQELVKEAEGKSIEWIWVRGHGNDVFNHRVDALAEASYLNPQEVVLVNGGSIKKIDIVKTEKALPLIKPEVGSLIYFSDSSKRYIVTLNDIIVEGKTGFLAKMLANNLGTELQFFPYNQEINLVKEKSDKESRMVFKSIEKFNESVSSAYTQMKRSCKHNIEKDGDSATCSTCAKDFGWYCPESKDKCCHYFSENRFVKLVTGEYMPIPKYHEPAYETYDGCIFCGEPEERK